ncbi:hypothetical protein RJ55_05334 [Drechmeria coniospora]|nr:hypothetical protein RJ55_05334 [Drechmeria coniospora]
MERPNVTEDASSDHDVDMKDASEPAGPDNDQSPDRKEAQKDEPQQPASDAEEEEEDGDDEDEDSPGMFQIIQKMTTYLCTVESEGEELAAGFQRIPNRRVLPDYFEVIAEPVAFSTIRGKLQRKLYTSVSEFVKDVAQICHNAQVYNRPSAPIFSAAVRLRDIFQEELRKLVGKGHISEADAKLPDLGELPPVEESSSRGSEVGDAEDDEDDDEEDEDDDDDESSDDDDDDDDDDDKGGGRRRRRRERNRDRSFSVRRDRDDDKDDDGHKKRGRPPMVLTPMEARISSILKGLRKPRNTNGGLLILPFERLPDKSLVPDYYQTITQPIALDNIKKKAKRKKYRTVDDVMADVELMFENAKLYNEDDSEVHQAAVELQREARELAEMEKAKPDDDFRDEDGKLPLGEIEHNGRVWRVGDWVHIRNPNDLAKPIVAQIFRTWQDRAGQKWINACWYYRPEQTVHRHEKHFFEREVVKTGQYRDHQIGEVLDCCFVMFVTRFNRGRPRAFPPDKDVYVCESRYNEDNFRFNKIKTWASCVPDEVRERDYEMDLFDSPRRMRKVPSPIKHLLREDAKETDPLPKPTWGSPNAPPIVGAVHRLRPGPNESPPPQATPPRPMPAAGPDAPLDSLPRSSMSAATREFADHSARMAQPHFQGPGPSPAPGHYGNVQPAPHFLPGTPAPMGSHPLMHQTPVPIPHQAHHIMPAAQMPMRPVQYQPHQQAGFPQNYAPAYMPSPVMPAHAPPPMNNPLPGNYTPGNVPHMPRGASTMTPAAGGSAPHANVYNPPRPPEVYILPDNVHELLPPELCRSFQRDGAGRILFFTAPPLERPRGGLSPRGAALGHSIRYLSGRDDWRSERLRKRKARDEARAHEASAKRVALDEHPTSTRADAVMLQAAGAIGRWFQRLEEEVDEWRTDAGLDGWSIAADEGTVRRM